MEAAETPDLAEIDRTYAQVTRRLLPILFICYVVAYLDRVNVGFAKLQMVRDLGFSEATYGLGAGIFFVGYCLCEMPSNLILSRLGARRWIARIMITWGVLSACTLFVRTPATFYLVRCLLGIAEAGLFPGVIFYLTCWYPAHRRGRVVALFMTAQPVSGVVGGPLSGWILQRFGGVRHMAGWQWLFLLEALPAILMGIVVFFSVDDRIRDASWLTADQKRLLESSISAESAHKHVYGSVLAILRSPRVWLVSSIGFTSTMGLYGIGFWLPSLIKSSGVDRPLQIGLLTMIPYAAATVAMILISRSSDSTGERRWHLACCTATGGMGLLFSTVFAGNTTLALAGLTLATCGIISSQPLFWNLPTAFLGGTAAAAAIGLIGSIANAAGFVSPYLVGWINTATHSATVGIYVLALSLFLSAAITFVVPASLVNRRRPDIP